MILAGINWHNMFVPSASLPELFLRGTLMYVFILGLMRAFRREAGSLSVPDLLVIVLVADAAQNGMSADYRSVTEAAVLVGTIFLWNYVLDWLSYRFPAFARMLHPAPLPLIREGRVQRRAMKAELMTMDELRSQLREHGVTDPSEVKRCVIEPDGHLSVLKYDEAKSAQQPPDRQRGLA